MSLDTPSDGGNSSGFATIPDVPVVPTSDRVNPQQVQSGTSRGEQQLGSPYIVADSADNRIYVRDSSTNIIQIIFGKLPDGTYGFIVSKPGIDATTLFT